MRRTKPILRFRVSDRDVVVRVYPKEIRKFIPDFGPPQNWTAQHWETVSLHLASIFQLLLHNRRRLLSRLQLDKKDRQIVKDDDASLAKTIKRARSQLGIDAAMARHKPSQEHKLWVQDKWSIEKSAYED
jgi:hypothetical protein